MKLAALFICAALAQDSHLPKNFEELQKSLEKSLQESMRDMQNFFQTDQFRSLDRMFRKFHDPAPRESSLDYFWRDSKGERVLVIKVGDVKKTPLDIRIEKEGVVISGKREEVREEKGPGGRSLSSRSYHFRVGPVPIPEDVDAKNPKFDQKDAEVLVKFPKIKKSTAGRVPLPTGKSDRKI